MNIVYLLPASGISGGHKVVFQQAEGLSVLGHRVTIICPEPPPTWYPLHRTYWKTSDFTRSAVLSQGDVCIATYWTTVSAAVRYFRGPVFHLCQGYEADLSFNAPLLKEIEAAYAHHTHKLVVSPHLAARLKSVGHDPVTYVGQTFDPEAFPPSEKRAFDRHPPTILLIGIFEADVKGIREALEALANVRRSGFLFRLCRVSTSPLSRVEKSIFIPDTYHYRLTPPQMRAIYRGCDLFIGPSYPEEGFGLPVLEALSSGLPVLASDTPGHRHIARNSAEYFPCKDISALSHKLNSLLKDGNRRAELSVRGPSETRRFHTKMVVDRLISIFENERIG